MAKAWDEVIKRYLEDAIAAEEHFENQLRDFAGEVDEPQIRSLFEQHADETRGQHQRLKARLKELGGQPSGFKGFMAGMFGALPKGAHLGHEKEEKSTQNLVMAYTVEQSECAMYEALACAAEAAGDTETHALAREIQDEERRTAEKVWNLIAPTARTAFHLVTTGEQRRAA